MPAISMVCLGPKPKISPKAIQAYLSEKWPDLPPLSGIEKGQESGQKKPTTIVFNMGETMCALALMPAPIPSQELEGPIATSIFWTDAASELNEHIAHLIVTVLGDLPPLKANILLTQLSAAVLATTDAAIGIYWGGSWMVHQTEFFCEIAEEFLPDQLPLLLWLNAQVGDSEDHPGRLAGFTHGMKAFGLMEFETIDSTDSPADLRERLYGLAGYLIENGPVIEDGHTVGGEGTTEKIRVKFADSKFGHEGQVMRLNYETAKKRWLPR